MIISHRVLERREDSSATHAEPTEIDFLEFDTFSAICFLISSDIVHPSDAGPASESLFWYRLVSHRYCDVFKVSSLYVSI